MDAGPIACTSKNVDPAAPHTVRKSISGRAFYSHKPVIHRICGSILGIAINTVKVLKNRAVQKLKDYFAQNNT